MLHRQQGTDTPHLIYYPEYAKWHDITPYVEVLNFVNSSLDMCSNRRNFLGRDNIFCGHLGIQP